MPTVDLTINSNIVEVTNGVNKTVEATDKLEKETKQYQQASQQAFGGTAENIQKTNREISNMQPVTARISSAFKLLGGVMAGAFSVAAIVKWGKAVVSSTDAGQDALERFKSAVGESIGFLNRSIATLDFSNLISGLRQAYEEGKRYADVLDEISDRQRAAGIQTLDIETEIIELRTIARNRQLDVTERQAALDKIIELEQKKLDVTKSITQQALQNELQRAAVISGLREDEILDFITNFDKFKPALEEGARLQAELSEAMRMVTTFPESDVWTQEYYNLLKSITPLQQQNIDLYNKTNLIAEELRISITEAAKADIAATNSQLSAVEALARLKNQLYNELIAGEKESTEAVKEGDDIKKIIEEAEIKRQLELLDIIIKNNLEFQKLVDALGDEDIDISIGDDPTGAIADYEELEDVIARSTASQRAEIEKNIEQLERWRLEGRITVDAYEEELARLQGALEDFNTFADEHPLAAALGIENQEQLDQIKDFVGQLGEFVNEIIAQQVEATERIIDDQNQRIDEQEQLVNREFELKKEGLANNYAVEQENLEKMQRARDEAIKQREKQIRLQRTLSTIEASISLVTASANIIKGFSGIPVVGVVLGLAAVAAMIAGFIAAQSKVKDATQFAKGGLLTGKRHSEGGIRIPGTNIEVEGNEFITNRRATAKYLPLLEAINKDDQAKMRLFFDRNYAAKFQGGSFNFDIDKSKRLGEIVDELRKGEKDVIYGQGYIIEKAKGYTRKINLN